MLPYIYSHLGQSIIMQYIRIYVQTEIPLAACINFTYLVCLKKNHKENIQVTMECY